MGTDWGRRIVHALTESAGLHQDTFGTDPLKTAYKEGQRSVALWLIRDVQQIAPDEYIKMITENMNRRTET
jgi:lambda repressor-like predicted transcriptional regulator